MPLPNQNIPEWKKDKDWMIKCCASIVQMSQTSRVSKARDKFCYDIWHGIQEESNYDYLRKVGDYEYPAKVRFVPLIRPKGDRLISEETKRPFSFRAYTIDTTSIKSKEDKKFEYIVGKMTANIKGIHDQHALAQKEIAIQKSQIQQQVAQFQESGEPIPPEMQMQVEQINTQLDYSDYIINHQRILSSDELEKTEFLFKYDYKEFLEVLSERGVQYLIANQELHQMFSQGMEDRVITDKEYYYVDWDPGMPDPVARKTDIMGFYYGGDSEITDVGDAEWCMEERWMSVNQIVDEMGDEIDFEAMEKLKKRSSYINTQSGYGYGSYGYNHGANSIGSGNTSVDGCGSDTLYGNAEDYANVIRVSMCYWQSPRKLEFKKSPNPHQEGKFFTKLMKDGDRVRPDKGEEKEKGYINDLYAGVVIDQDIFLRTRKKNVVRRIDRYSRIKLPYVGPAFNYYTRRPYSLVWAAKDIQILYNLVHYHKELWIALSGVKGFIMDKSQKPEGMSMTEWTYQRKLGIGWIQSVRSGLNRQPTFNQFQQFDDTLGQSIQYLLTVLDHLESLCGDVMGVSRQRMGEVAPTDQVGTTEQSIQMSSLVTEIMYYKHDKVKKEVLTRLANLCKIAWKDGKRGSYVLGDMGQELLNIPKGQINRADYDIFVSDSGKENKLINDMRQVAFGTFQKGEMNFAQMVKMFRIENIRELEKTVDKYTEISRKNNMEDEQARSQMVVQQKEADNEFKMLLEKQKGDIKQLSVDVEHAKLDWEKQKFNIEQGLAQQEQSVEANQGQQKIDNEQEMETAFLQEDKRQANMEYELSKTELAIKGIEATIDDVQEGNKKRPEKVSDKN